MKKNCNIDSKFKALISPLSAEEDSALEASSEQMALPQLQQVVREGLISISATAKLADLPQPQAAAIGVKGLKAKAKKNTTNAKPAFNHHRFEQKLREEAQQLVKETLKLAEDVTALKAKFSQLYERLAKAEHKIRRRERSVQTVGEESNDDLPISIATLQTL